jgi:hypothetical protein
MTSQPPPPEQSNNSTTGAGIQTMSPGSGRTTSAGAQALLDELTARVAAKVNQTGSSTLPAFPSTTVVTKEEADTLVSDSDEILEAVLRLPGLRIKGRNGEETNRVWWRECAARVAPGAIWSQLLDVFSVKRGWPNHGGEWNGGEGQRIHKPGETVPLLADWARSLTREQIRALNPEPKGRIEAAIVRFADLDPASLLGGPDDNRLVMVYVRFNSHLSSKDQDMLWETWAAGVKRDHGIAPQKNGGHQDLGVLNGLAQDLLSHDLVPPKNVKNQILEWALTKESEPDRRVHEQLGLDTESWRARHARRIAAHPLLGLGRADLIEIWEAGKDGELAGVLSQNPEMDLAFAKRMLELPEVDTDTERRDFKGSRKLVKNLVERGFANVDDDIFNFACRRANDQEKGGLIGQARTEQKGAAFEEWLRRKPLSALNWARRCESEHLNGIGRENLLETLASANQVIRSDALDVALRIGPGPRANEVDKQSTTPISPATPARSKPPAP